MLYAILTEESIGQLFMAGILPGLLLTALFMATILLATLVNLEMGPRGKRTSFEKLAALPAHCRS
ncbi:MAG: TRAP transporter large permease subunit [Paracoccaceae bacterium]